MSTGTLQATLTQQAGPVLALAISPDGSRLAVADENGTIRLSASRAEGPSQQDRLYVYIYVDTNDISKIRKIAGLTDELVDMLGFNGPLDIEINRGSWIRKSTARVKRGLTSSDVKARLAHLEQAAELYAIDDKQAQVDAKFASTLSLLIESLKEVPSACVRAGSTLIIKYEINGKAVVQSRKLTERETQALEKYPEIQNDPSNLMGALAMAVEQITEASRAKLS